MENTYVLATLRKWWWLLIFVAAIGGAGAYFLSSEAAPEYRAEATLLVIDQTTPGVSRTGDLNTSADLAAAFSDLITLRPLLEEVLVRGGFSMSLSQISESVAVEHEPDTQFVRVVASAADPILARDLANVVATVFIDSQQVRLINQETIVTLIEPALAPSRPSSQNTGIVALAGGLSALVLTAALLLFRAYLDDTVQSAGQVRELVGLLTLGQVGRFRAGRSAGDALVAASHPNSEAAEAYRSLRTNLSYALEAGGGSDPHRAVVITSAAKEEGKSTTAANLAIVFGDAGLRVVLVDADLRRPSLHRLMNGDNGFGLANLLTGNELGVQAVARGTAHPNVSLISAGPVPPNPSELLGSPRITAVIDELRAQYDIVIIDSPPMLGVSDAMLATTAADAVVAVVRTGKTRTHELVELVERLAVTGRPIAGVVLNRDPRASRKGRYYYQSERSAEAPVELEPDPRFNP